MAKEKVSDIYSTDNLEDYLSVLFTEFSEGREPYEDVWKECWWNYIGQYNPEQKLQTTEGSAGRSRIFFRLTPQKVRAAHAKIMESLGLEIPFKMIPLDDNAYTEYKLQSIANAQKDIIRNQFKRIGLRDKFDTEVLLMCIYGTSILKGPVLVNKTTETVEENVQHVMGVDVPMWKIPFKNYPRFKRVYKNFSYKEVYPVSIWDFYMDNNADSADKSIGCMERKYYSPYEFQQRFFNNEDFNQDAVIRAYNLAAEPDDEEELSVTRGDKFMGTNSVKDTKISVIE